MRRRPRTTSPGRWRTRRLRGEGRAIGQAGYMSAILYNGLGRYDEALAGARDACEHDELGVRGFALVELIEAAARGGSPEVAAEALPELEERTVAAGTDWALGILARSRALLASGDAAERALPRGDRAARTQPDRRPSRPRPPAVRRVAARENTAGVDAREQLRPAYDMFHGMGAEAFAERARRELLATGATPASAPLPARADLTPQEAQIARLAATDTPTRRSAASCSSAPGPSSTTSARCSPSSGSPPDENSVRS